MTPGEIAVAAGTLALALATSWLALITRQGERERRREAQILDAHPLTVSLEPHRRGESTFPTVSLLATNRSDRPCLDVTGTIRYPDGGAMSPAGHGIIDEGGSEILSFELGTWADESSLEIEISSRGMMGQRVDQTFRWLMVDIKVGVRAAADTLILTRVVITPTIGEAVVIDHQW